MAKKNVVMSSNITLQGEKGIYAMATKMQLDKYVVFVCGESIKSKEADIKENIKKILAAEYKDKKFVFQVNKYLPNDAAMMITKDIDKYHVLTSMGQINKNEYYEELIIEELTGPIKRQNQIQQLKKDMQENDEVKNSVNTLLNRSGIKAKSQERQFIKNDDKPKINNNRKTTKK